MARAELIMRRFRRLLALAEDQAGVENELQALQATPDGEAELRGLETTVNAFGRLGLRRTHRGELRYDGPALFPPSLSLASKIQLVLAHDPPILRLQRPGLDRKRYESEWTVFNTLSAAGLRLPYCQYPIGYYRVDFAYPEWHLAIEADGLVHEREEGPRSDRRRDHLLQQAGWRVLHVAAQDYSLPTSYLVQELAWRIRERVGEGASRYPVVLDERRFAIVGELVIPPILETAEADLDQTRSRWPFGFLEDLDIEIVKKDDDWSSVFAGPDD